MTSLIAFIPLENLSDEALSDLSDFLWQLASEFDSQFFSRMQQFELTKRQKLVDPHQPWRRNPLD